MRRSEERLPARRENGGWLALRGQSGFPVPPFAGSPWQMVRQMQEDMDRLFSQFLGGQGGAGGGAGTGPASTTVLRGSPDMDISEDRNGWWIEAELPGVKPDDVEVRVEAGFLILKAEPRPDEREVETEEGGRRYIRRERRFRLFETVLPLPENAKEDAIRCEFRDGVLTVHIPKDERAPQQGRRIPIGQGSSQPSAQGHQAQQGSAAAGSSPRPQESRQHSDSGREEDEAGDRETAGAGRSGGR